MSVLGEGALPVFAILNIVVLGALFLAYGMLGRKLFGRVYKSGAENLGATQTFGLLLLVAALGLYLFHSETGLLSIWFVLGVGVVGISLAYNGYMKDEGGD